MSVPAMWTPAADWLIGQGEEFENDQILPCQVYEAVAGIGFFSEGRRSFQQKLLYRDDESQPTRAAATSVKELCQVEWSLDASAIWGASTARSGPE